MKPTAARHASMIPLPLPPPVGFSWDPRPFSLVRTLGAIHKTSYGAKLLVHVGNSRIVGIKLVAEIEKLSATHVALDAFLELFVRVSRLSTCAEKGKKGESCRGNHPRFCARSPGSQRHIPVSFLDPSQAACAR